MTVRRKLAVCVALLLLLATGSAVRALLDRQRASAALQALRDARRQQQALSSMERSLQLRWREISVLAALAPSREQLQEVRTRLDQLDAEAMALRELPAAAAVAAPYAAAVGSWRNALAAMEARQPVPDLVAPVDALDALADVVEESDRLSVAASEAVIATHRDGNVTTLWILAVSIASGATVVALLSIAIARGLAQLEEASRQMGDGNLGFRIEVTSTDEFARAGRTFNAMAARLATALDEARLARVEAEAALALKTAFVRAMSHDLRTPLTAVLAYVDLIEEDVHQAGLKATAEDLTALRRSVLVLDVMVGELLDLARLEAGRMPVVLDVVDVRALITEVMAGIRPLLEQRRNHSTVEADGAVLVTDASKLRHILQNLLGNACKFTDAGHVGVRGRAVCAADGTPGFVLTVFDTGIGMSADEAARIFEPFEQANASVQQRFGGTGLGLAIVRGYVDLLEGTISVESVPGQGTAVTVWLPDGAPRVSAVA